MPVSSPPSVPARVSTLELFFDLVFVFTITQVTAIVVHSPSGAGAARAAITLAVIYYMYGGYAWLTNTNEHDNAARRGVLLAGMAAFFACSLAVPTAFGSGGLPFAIAYLAIILVHAAGFIVFLGPASLGPVAHLLPWNMLSAGLILAAAWGHGSVDWYLWTAAVGVQLLTPVVVRVGENFRINAAHFAERHGLVILIVLGESLVSIGLASESQAVDLRLVLGVLAGLLAAAAMWWMYFAADDDRAAVAMENAPPERRPAWAVTGYFMAHLLMIYGILVLAAGTRLSVDDLLAPASWASAWLVACGAGIYAAGSAAFRLALHFANPAWRAVGAVACLCVAPLGRHGSVAAELAGVAVVLGIMLLVERWSLRRPAATVHEASEKMTA